jgi:hypothetical protein
VFQNVSNNSIVALCVQHKYEDGTGLRALDYPQTRPGDLLIARSSGAMFERTTLKKMSIPIPPSRTLEEMQNDQMNRFLAKHPGLDRSKVKVSSITMESRMETSVNGKLLWQGFLVSTSVLWALFDDHTFYGPQKDGHKLQLDARHRHEFFNELQAAPDKQIFLGECQGRLHAIEEEVVIFRQEFQAQLDAAEDKREVFLEMRRRNFQPKAALGRDGSYWNVIRETMQQFRMIRKPEHLDGYIQSAAERARKMLIERIVPVEEEQGEDQQGH